MAFAPTGHQVKARGNALELKHKELKALKGRNDICKTQLQKSRRLNIKKAANQLSRLRLFQ